MFCYLFNFGVGRCVIFPLVQKAVHNSIASFVKNCEKRKIFPFFKNWSPLVRRHLFDHLLWSIVSSTERLIHHTTKPPRLDIGLKIKLKISSSLVYFSYPAIWTYSDLGTSMAFDFCLCLFSQIVTSASLLKSVSVLTNLADFRDSSNRTSSILRRIVSS